jgi:hypothetical protein
VISAWLFRRLYNHETTSPRIKKSIMKRFAALCATAWSAAALLYFGQHSVALIVLSGVLVLAGFDLLRPDTNKPT